MDCAKATRRLWKKHAGLSGWSRFILAEPLWLGLPFKLLLKVTGSSVKKARYSELEKKQKNKQQYSSCFLPKNRKEKPVQNGERFRLCMSNIYLHGLVLFMRSTAVHGPLRFRTTAEQFMPTWCARPLWREQNTESRSYKDVAWRKTKTTPPLTQTLPAHTALLPPHLPVGLFILSL